ncbi:MAG: hypothetical protein JKY24_03625 [Pseudomonadales bacterium]|nr:hypothetical protein [Pseudomonadales bacterium]
MRQQRKVIRPGLLVTVIIGSILMAVYPLTVFSKEANILVEWGSDEGVLRLSRSKAKVDFFPLANNFESQTNKVYCGVASSTIVLNALRVRNTETKKFLPKAESVLDKEDLKYISGRFSPYFDRYTQNNVLNDQTKSSPVGAYDEESDSVLVMDVNSNKANWVWVTLKDLVAAMATYDTVENRGYLLISEK